MSSSSSRRRPDPTTRLSLWISSSLPVARPPTPPSPSRPSVAVRSSPRPSAPGPWPNSCVPTWPRPASSSSTARAARAVPTAPRSTWARPPRARRRFAARTRQLRARASPLRARRRPSCPKPRGCRSPRASSPQPPASAPWSPPMLALSPSPPRWTGMSREWTVGAGPRPTSSSSMGTTPPSPRFPSISPPARARSPSWTPGRGRTPPRDCPDAATWSRRRRASTRPGPPAP